MTYIKSNQATQLNNSSNVIAFPRWKFRDAAPKGNGLDRDAYVFTRHIGEAAREKWGEPNDRMSTSTNLRFGNNGSKSVDLEKGLWHDKETGEGGGFLKLIGASKPEEGYDWLRAKGFISDGSQRERLAAQEKAEPVAEKRDKDEKRDTRLKAQEIWQASVRDKAAIKAYLRSRGLHKVALPPLARFLEPKSATLLKVGPVPSFGIIVHPIMGIRDDGTWYRRTAVHLIYLNKEGGKHTSYPIPRQMFGPVSGGFIPLSRKEDIEQADSILASEGIETVLAAMETSSLPGIALGSSGNFANAKLPLGPQQIIICADSDEGGQKMALKLARRLVGEGRRVRVATPKQGSDWNDALNEVDADRKKLRKQILEAPLFEGVDEDNSDTQAIRIMSSGEWAASFKAPEWLVYRLLQRGFLYALTAPPGGGKTAVALLLAFLVAMGRELGDIEVEQGRVLYLAGENPNESKVRWITMCDELGVDPDDVPAHIIESGFSIEQQRDLITAKAKELGGLALVIVDTSATFFQGDEENANAQMLDHARMLRKLTRLPGKPTVLVLCHPSKAATAENMVPRGGSAFLGEIDGNLVCPKHGTRMDLSPTDKLRGPRFQPIALRLRDVESNVVKDTKGRPWPTVMAEALTDEKAEKTDRTLRRNEDRLLVAMIANPGASYRTLATGLDWVNDQGQPNNSRVQSIMGRLAKEKLVHNERGQWSVTPKGRQTAKELENETRLK